jgi:hypothetical protein
VRSSLMTRTTLRSGTGWSRPEPRKTARTRIFYAVLHQQARTARQRYNAEHDKPLATDTYSGQLLPGRDDRDRYLLEAGTRFAVRLDSVLRVLITGSLCDGHEHAADFPGFRPGVIVRADDGHETYMAIRITGSVGRNLTMWTPRPRSSSWSRHSGTVVLGRAELPAVPIKEIAGSDGVPFLCC